MIDELDQRIEEWVSTTVPAGKVFHIAPAEMAGKQGVSLYLLETRNTPPLRGMKQPPATIALRYLVTTWFEDSRKAHRLLGELMFAAMDHAEFEIESEPVPLALWQALAIAPRPAFILRVPLHKARPEKRAPRVRTRLEMQYAAIRPLAGQVFGPGGIALMGAKVSLPSLNQTTRTDFKGRFHFTAVPAQPPLRAVHINAKGRDVVVPIEPPAEGQSLQITLNEDQI